MVKRIISLTTELMFSFEDRSSIISEGIEETHYRLVMIDNIGLLTIPENVSISISAEVDNDTSNVTQGNNCKILYINCGHSYFL